MGFINSFSKGFKEGQERARSEAYRKKDVKNIPVKLIEPSTGTIIKFEITEKRTEVAKLYMSQLEEYAKALIKLDPTANYNISGNQITINLSESMAEQQRIQWRKKS